MFPFKRKYWMARSILPFTYSQTIVANTYLGFGGPSYGDATESLTQLYIYGKSKLYGLYINPTSTANDRYYTIRNNTVNTNLKIGPWNTADGTNPVSNNISINIANGDAISLSYGAAANSAFQGRVILKPYGRHFYVWSSGMATGSVSFSAGTRYSTVGGLVRVISTNEDQAHYKVKVPGTMKNFQLKVATNTTGTANVFTRISNTLGNLNIFVGAGQTGHFTDLSRSDVVTADATVNFRSVIATAAISFSQFSVHFEPTNPGSRKQDLVIASSTTYTPSLTPTYSGIAGAISASSGESNRTLTFGYPVKLSNLRIYVTTNSCNADIRITTRVNSANTTLLKTITVGSTGWQENNSDSVILGPNDTVAFRFEALTAPTGTVGITSIGITAEDLSPPDYPKISMQ